MAPRPSTCADLDPICSGNLDDPIGNWASHLQPAYIDSGLVDQAASFVAAKALARRLVEVAHIAGDFDTGRKSCPAR